MPFSILNTSNEFARTFRAFRIAASVRYRRRLQVESDADFALRQPSLDRVADLSLQILLRQKTIWIVASFNPHKHLERWGTAAICAGSVENDADVVRLEQLILAGQRFSDNALHYPPECASIKDRYTLSKQNLYGYHMKHLQEVTRWGSPRGQSDMDRRLNNGIKYLKNQLACGLKVSGRGENYGLCWGRHKLIVGVSRGRVVFKTPSVQTYTFFRAAYTLAHAKRHCISPSSSSLRSKSSRFER